jgi:DNA repair proteins
MRVYEAKIVYSLVSLGEEVRLDRPEMVADYLRSAFDECPMQEAFYCVYLDRKNHPIGRHLVTLGTATSTLVAPREVFRGAILAGATALVGRVRRPG